ncbi:uncharacterized protein B0P05DRAFT_19600 [Gilbertella persicaria]|uniref:uncharacterized protein n=1 Tax=Gilbertella persicaria TaxID=101096 RepID=UPI00221EBDC0|nr:uncharacterized protein B0P05DRAFT_19600 [Gilbertella persicaria]KAI8087031.1 hypothetical protein B0P05DRAFT_19600 [Gilbertella persicaria]
MRPALSLCLSSALLAFSAFAQQATLDTDSSVLKVDDGFSTFHWRGDSVLARESFHIDVEDIARIQITDFMNRGDMFEIFDNGVSLGITSSVEQIEDDEGFASTPEQALSDDRFSKGIFELAKGAHKITIKATGPYQAGAAAIRLLDQVADVSFYRSRYRSHVYKEFEQEYSDSDDEELLPEEGFEDDDESDYDYNDEDYNGWGHHRHRHRHYPNSNNLVEGKSLENMKTSLNII